MEKKSFCGLTDEESKSLEGRVLRTNSYGEIVISLITGPKWNAKENRWEALANVEGALCLIEVKVRVDGKDILVEGLS